MQPFPTDILRGVLENLEALVFPQLQDAHALSVAKCTRILLHHVMLRLAHEIPSLLQDSVEKRALLHALSADIDSLPAPQATLLADTARRASAAAHEPPITQVGASLQEVTAENDRLKQALEDVIDALYAHRSALGEAPFARLIGPIRAQLRAQTERELAMVAPAYGAEPFPF